MHRQTAEIMRRGSFPMLDLLVLFGSRLKHFVDCLPFEQKKKRVWPQFWSFVTVQVWFRLQSQCIESRLVTKHVLVRQRAFRRKINEHLQSLHDTVVGYLWCPAVWTALHCGAGLGAVKWGGGVKRKSRLGQTEERVPPPLPNGKFRVTLRLFRNP